MSANDRLLGVRAKIERAKYHVRDLESCISAFRKTDPYQLVINEHPDLGKRAYQVRVKIMTPIPSELPLIVGESIYQLRSALDHLAGQLVEANGKIPDTSTYFPIAQTAAKYKASLSGKVKGMSPDAVSVIDALQPYGCGRGNDLWVLNKLNNTDKHRLLLMVGCGTGALMVKYPSFDPSSRNLSPTTITDAVSDFFRSAGPNKFFPMRNDGDMLVEFGWGRESPPKVNEDVYSTYDIAFGETEPYQVYGKPVIPFLHQLAGLVDGVVNQFIPFL